MTVPQHHVAQMGADLAVQLMFTTLFRIVVDLSEDPDGLLTEIREALTTMADTYPLPQLPPEMEKDVRDGAHIVINGIMANASAAKPE